MFRDVVDLKVERVQVGGDELVDGLGARLLDFAAQVVLGAHPEGGGVAGAVGLGEKGERRRRRKWREGLVAVLWRWLSASCCLPPLLPRQ